MAIPELVFFGTKGALSRFYLFPSSFLSDFCISSPLSSEILLYPVNFLFLWVAHRWFLGRFVRATAFPPCSSLCFLLVLFLSCFFSCATLLLLISFQHSFLLPTRYVFFSLSGHHKKLSVFRCFRDICLYTQDIRLHFM